MIRRSSSALSGLRVLLLSVDEDRNGIYYHVCGGRELLYSTSVLLTKNCQPFTYFYDRRRNSNKTLRKKASRTIKNQTFSLYSPDQAHAVRSSSFHPRLSITEMSSLEKSHLILIPHKSSASSSALETLNLPPVLFVSRYNGEPDSLGTEAASKRTRRSEE